MDDIAEVYEEVSSLLKSLAREVARRCPYGVIDVDEIHGIANLIFVRAYQTHDPERGEFVPRLITKVRDALKKFSRAHYLRKLNFVNYDFQADDAINLTPYGYKLGRPRDWKFEEFLEAISDDAAEAVVVAFEEDEDGRPRRQSRAAVVNRLNEMGWKKERVARAFREIQNQLEE